MREGYKFPGLAGYSRGWLRFRSNGRTLPYEWYGGYGGGTVVVVANDSPAAWGGEVPDIYPEYVQSPEFNPPFPYAFPLPQDWTAGAVPFPPEAPTVAFGPETRRPPDPVIIDFPPGSRILR